MTLRLHMSEYVFSNEGLHGNPVTPRRPLQTLLEDPSTSSDFTPVSTETYAALDYWRFRFTQEHSKEWLATYSDIKAVVNMVAPDRSSRILLVGNGNSSLPMDMADDGYENITATDYADTAVAAMRSRTAASHPRISWAVADMLDLAAFGDASFDIVLDKAAMDAVLAGRGDTWDPPDDLLSDAAKIGQVRQCSSELVRTCPIIQC